MFLTPKLGIDLGTTYTLVFVPGKGVVLREPTVVAVSEQDKKILAIGDEAKEMIGRTPDDIVAYKPMKDGVIADYHATEVMLRYFMKKALPKYNIFKPEVLISVPAGVTSTQRRAVIEAAIKAGARAAYVIKEPILAAIGAGIPVHRAQGHMVVDIGGGTTDVAVISLGGIVSSASVKCAGNRIDSAIVDYVKKKYNLAIGEKTAEHIKIAIGSALPVENEKTVEVKGRDYLTGLPKKTRIKTNEIVEAIQQELKEITQAIKKVLQDTPPELAADVIDNGITLTGGSSQLQKLPELIYKKTGVKAYVDEDALYCVAKGTGVALQHLDTYKKLITAKKQL